MSFTILDCEQRSPAWYAARAGRLTATGAAAMLSKGKRAGEDTIGKEELRLTLALESLRGVPLEEDTYESDYMRRGREREEEGRAAYEARTGEIVTTVGFLRHDTLPIGCSPDGLIGDEGGLELKCPKRTTHFRYLQKRTIPSEYLPQVTHSLFVTERLWWDFCSFCPELPGAARVFLVRVRREEVDLAAYELAFRMFWVEVESVKETVCALSVAPELVHA